MWISVKIIKTQKINVQNISVHYLLLTCTPVLCPPIVQAALTITVSTYLFGTT